MQDREGPLMPTEPRILITADVVSGRLGGEAALPYHYYRVLRQRGYPVWLVTLSSARTELSGIFPDDDHIVYVDDPRSRAVLWRLDRRLPPQIGRVTVGSLSRLLDMIKQRSVVRETVLRHSIQVVHQPAPVSPMEPSILFDVGAPVIIGPLNGGMDFPPNLRYRRKPVERALRSILRSASVALSVAVPGKRRAALLLVANERTRRSLPPGSTGAVQTLVENGVDLSTWYHRDSAPLADHSIFVFVGRLVDWKAVDLLLKAFAKARTVAPMSLRIIGDGTELSSLRELAQVLGVEIGSAEQPGHVEFSGWLAQPECSAALSGARALVLPSLLECGGAVVLEAMACGRPVIVTDWGGPADYVVPDCGLLIAPDSEAAVVEGFADGMIQLSTDPGRADSMGVNGRRRVEALFDWDAKVDVMLNHYRSVGESTQ